MLATLLLVFEIGKALSGQVSYEITARCVWAMITAFYYPKRREINEVQNGNSFVSLDEDVGVPISDFRIPKDTSDIPLTCSH